MGGSSCGSLTPYFGRPQNAERREETPHTRTNACDFNTKHLLGTPTIQHLSNIPHLTFPDRRSAPVWGGLAVTPLVRHSMPTPLPPWLLMSTVCLTLRVKWPDLSAFNNSWPVCDRQHVPTYSYSNIHIGWAKNGGLLV